MATKQSQRAEINSFVQGLITEASPLNFPENASANEENFEINRDGSRNRRFGMDLEDVHTFIDSGVPIDALGDMGYTTFKWEEVAGDLGLEVLVVQMNRRVLFFDIRKNSISTEGYLGYIDIVEFPTNTSFSFASAEGALVAVAGVDTFAVISYEDGEFTYYLDRLKIRDLFGIEETNPIFEEDPSARGELDEVHYYNLQNQSWGIPRRAEVVFPRPGGGAPIVNHFIVDPILYIRSNAGYSPSNSQQVWMGLQFSPRQLNGQTMQMEDPFEMMYLNLYHEALGSVTSSARGYFIIDALRRGQSRYEQLQYNLSKYPELNKNAYDNFSTWFSDFQFPRDYTTGGASCVAEFAGRIFYSGFTGEVVDGDKRSPNYTNYVFFSTLVKNKSDLNKCYQLGDPTSREESDIVDTDGGFLRISEAREIQSLVSIGSSLIVIATNGIWSIDGGSDYGFTATNYKVTKLSSFGGLSRSSIVVEGERIYYWSEDGIYSIGRNELGDMAIQSLTITTIQSLYDELTLPTKLTAVGSYDTFTKKIRWLYNSSIPLSSNNVTKELILDISLGCFSQNRIFRNANRAVDLISCFQSSPYRTRTEQESVFVGTESVLVDTDDVVVESETRQTSYQETKYLGITEMEGRVFFTFCFYKNPRFLDWENIDGIGVDAKAFCLTGTQTVGDSGIDKQIPYLFMSFRRTEDSVDEDWVPQNKSGCLFRCQWNFANSINSKKWSPLQQAYRYRKPFWAEEPNGEYDYGFEVIQSKNKVRGKGKAFALYFETEPLKDCQILGWNLSINGNSIT